MFDTSSPYVVKKQFGERPGDSLAAHEPVARNVTTAWVVFLSAKIRGSADYVASATMRWVMAANISTNSIPAMNFRVMWQSRSIKTARPETRGACSREEYGYLHDVFYHEQAETARRTRPRRPCGESQDWVRRLCRAGVSDLPRLSPPAVVAAEEHAIPGGKLMPVPGNTGLFGAAAELSAAAGCSGLARRCRTVTQRGWRRSERPTASVLGEEEPALETVLKASRRAYPAVLLADDNLWRTCKGKRKANMALSPEESRVLRSPVVRWDERRAYGRIPDVHQRTRRSGKTTILQYPVHGVSILSTTRARRVHRHLLHLPTRRLCEIHVVCAQTAPLRSQLVHYEGDAGSS